ncbi:MAG: 30S ribosomal protein S4 [Lachnospiraceae bacterium]|nr:30S ribosomal protein S4 [Lachnospiraceae bacterium]
MAVNRDPVLKRCRYLGISPMVVGIAKESNKNPNANSRRKVSEYGMQLKEKQKLKFIYGVLENQFRHYYDLATKMEGQAGNNIIVCLESRLDNVVFRMGLALTRREARQLVNHGHFLVNGKRVDIPSYRIKVGDVISLRDKSKSSVKFKENIEKTNGRLSPMWLDNNKEEFKATITRMPSIEDLDYDVEAHLIVELYSK